MHIVHILKLHNGANYMKLMFCYKMIALSILVLSIINFTACGYNKYSVPEITDLQSKDNSTSVFLVTDKDEYSSSEDKIVYTLKNNSQITFSKEREDFVLEYYYDDGWKEYSFKENRQIDLESYEFDLENGESTRFEIILKWHYDMPMKKGYYRILQYGLVSNVFCIR